MAYWKTTPRHTKREAMYIRWNKRKRRVYTTRLILLALTNTRKLPDKRTKQVATFLFSLKKWKVVSYIISPSRIPELLDYAQPKYQAIRKMVQTVIKKSMDDFMWKFQNEILYWTNQKNWQEITIDMSSQ